MGGTGAQKENTSILQQTPENWNMMEYGFRVMYAGVPSDIDFGVGGQSYSNFLASSLATLGYLEPPGKIIGSQKTHPQSTALLALNSCKQPRRALNGSY